MMDDLILMIVVVVACGVIAACVLNMIWGVAFPAAVLMAVVGAVGVVVYATLPSTAKRK